MASRPREWSESGIYHATSRGSGRHTVFEDDRDRSCLKHLLASACDDHEVNVLTWCFMANHVHLLLESPEQLPSDFMRDVFSQYAIIYNRRHDHVGHDFQGRFHSAPVEDETHLQAVVPYIHLNPAHGDWERARDYPWSGYGEVLQGCGLADVDWLVGLYGSVEAFEEAHRVRFEQRQAAVLSHAGRRLTDDEAHLVYLEILRSLDITGELGQSERGRRNRALAALKGAGLSVRQIERLSGLGRSIIQRAA